MLCREHDRVSLKGLQMLVGKPKSSTLSRPWTHFFPRFLGTVWETVAKRFAVPRGIRSSVELVRFTKRFAGAGTFCPPPCSYRAYDMPITRLFIYSLAWQSACECIPYHTGTPLGAPPKLGGILRVLRRYSGLVRLQLMQRRPLAHGLLLVFTQEPHQLAPPRA